MAKMYYEKDCDINYLDGKTFTVPKVWFQDEFNDMEKTPHRIK